VRARTLRTMRTRLRRIKRYAVLGLLVGGFLALRRTSARRHGRVAVGPPPTWPPLQPGEPPVAAVGDLVTAADHPAADTSPAPGAGTDPGAAAVPVVSDDPVAALGDLATAAAQTWVEPVDGACPVTHPVKANGNSGIYHLPGGQFYARTRPTRCYADAAAAEADGYRAAKG
jgi:hypothetical protein